MYVRWNGGHFVAEPQVQGQVRAEVPIILNIASDDGLALASLCHWDCRDIGQEVFGLVGEEFVHGPERKRARQLRDRPLVVLVALEPKAEFQGMETFGQKSIV